MTSRQHLALDDFENADERAYRKVLRMASAREVSSAHVRDRLLREGYSEDTVANVLERAVEHRVVDDVRYAEALVRSKIAAGKGLAGVQRELEELGICLDDLEAYQEHVALGEEHELSRALDVLSRRSITAKNKRDAAYRRLMQAGFSPAVASQAAGQWARSLAKHDFGC